MIGEEFASQRQPALELDAVSFSYGAGPVLADLSLRVGEGEFVSLLGPSGSGKSTVLRLLAGLEKPQSGSIRHSGVPVSGPGIHRGVVFQDYSLFPWMSLTENVVLAIGKAHPQLSRSQRHELAEEYLDLVGLGDACAKYPRELSGGMCQRGAIARALAMGAPVLLMDEPFGALDPVNRTRLQDLLLEVWNSSQPARTIVFVTHDVDEAILLADRVVVLGACPGRIIANLAIRIPRPRPRQQVYSWPEFQALRKSVTEHLQGDMLQRLAAPYTMEDAAGI
jgi:NitT/TauT family transport system ATP-binding protein